MKLWSIAGFELSGRLRRLSTYVYFLVFFTLGFLFITIAAGALKGATVEFGTGGKVLANSPFSLAMLVLLVAHFGLPITAAIAGRATFQDIDHGTEPFFFTAPISKLDYLGGRFLGGLAVSLILYAAIIIGAFMAATMPFLDAGRVGPQNPWAYVAPYFFALLPNLLFTSALFFSLATLFRRMLPVYAGGVVVMIGYLLGFGFENDIQNRFLAAMIDPFGLVAVERLTEYWTVSERNTLLVPFEGVLLLNRLVWVSAGIALLVVTYLRFDFSRAGHSPRRTGRAVAGDTPVAAVDATAKVPPPPAFDFSPGAAFRLLGTLSRLQFRETIKSPIFLVITLAGLLYLVVAAGSAGRLYDTPTYPVTYAVLEVFGGLFSLFILAIITIYSGELVWRERDVGLSPIFDALPIPRWVIFTAKLLALAGVYIVLLAILMVCGIAWQASQGYYRFELGLYVVELFGIQLTKGLSLCALAMLVHVIVNQKALGHFVMVLYYAAIMALPAFGLEQYLYLYGTAPHHGYSDMNGFGPFITPLAWFHAYWGILALLLAVVANAFWVRGLQGGFRSRARQAFTGLSHYSRLALGCLGVAFVLVGAYIYWNTNVVNRFLTQYQREERLAEYERRFKAQENTPQPRVAGVVAAVDIFPEERRVAIRATYRLENRTGEAITALAVTFVPEARLSHLALGRGETTEVAADDLGFRLLRLQNPIAPGETAQLEFALEHTRPGFVNEPCPSRVNCGDGLRLVENGTFFDTGWLLSIGYQPNRELAEDNIRRRHGFSPKKRMPDLDDIAARQRNYAFPDGDFITFEATVSTSPDQIAIAPGYLTREWTEGGRRYFHYKMDAPILNFYAFISARYAVHRDRWNDVAIEIFHHPGHTYNLERMVRGVKLTLDYCTRHFSPYQHRQVRIIEFPRYARFAQSFPNTIPYSEAIGFVARIDDSKPDALDFPLYVTAHEVAHQWWAHQVIGANTQGATVMSETLSQYTALMVMKETFGPEAMQKFLRHELDRYLIGRSKEKTGELPLLRVENQNYIHYNKGSLVMYALQDYVGEAAVNAALRDYLAAHAFRGPPYSTSADLLAALGKHTPEPFQYVLQDLFETITLYDNRAVRATASRRTDGRYDVHIEARLRKLRADPLGGEHEIPLGDWVDVGVLDGGGKPIYLEKHRVEGPAVDVTVIAAELPAKAGVDPLNKLVDRKPDDNVVAVEQAVTPGTP